MRVTLRRGIVFGLFDIVSALLLATIVLAAFPRPALAYVDPSVMTYTIQAVAGAAVALSAVLGVALQNVQNEYDFASSVVNGIGTSVGFTIAIVIMAGIRERNENNNIIGPLKGMPIVLFTAALMAIAFNGFSGLI